MIESTGPNFNPNELLKAQDLTKKIVSELLSSLELGMDETKAHNNLKLIFKKYSIEKLWHPSKIRFGSNTLKSFREQSDLSVILALNDIVYIDIGPVINGHEGDFGKTIIFNEDGDSSNFTKASEDIFNEVANFWKKTNSTGSELYEYASQCAIKMGYELNLSMKGHRVSDFPHAIYYKGGLNSVSTPVKTGFWVLEILIHCPKLNRNSFYEDILSN